MGSKYPEIHQLAMSRIPRSASFCNFTEQAIRHPYDFPVSSAGYMRPQLGRTQHEHEHFGHHLHRQNPHYHPQNHLFLISHEMHEVIQKEIEMERMREEIIMSEIVRMRAEERREQLMRERELALRRGGYNGFIDGSSSIIGFDSQRVPLWGTRVEDRSLGKGIVLPLPEKERLMNWRF